MILHLIHTSVLKELWYDKSFFLCLNKKLNEYPHVPKLAKFKPPRCPNGMFWNTLCFM